MRCDVMPHLEALGRRGNGAAGARVLHADLVGAALELLAQPRGDRALQEACRRRRRLLLQMIVATQNLPRCHGRKRKPQENRGTKQHDELRMSEFATFAQSSLLLLPAARA